MLVCRRPVVRSGRNASQVSSLARTVNHCRRGISPSFASTAVRTSIDPATSSPEAVYLEIIR